MTILFIDDDKDDTELFCEAALHLKVSDIVPGNNDGIRCIALNDGCAMIDTLTALHPPPDLIFLDINMPVMSGKDCLKYLKGHPNFAHIPIVIFSTAFKQSDVQEFMALGAIDCIQKPTSFQELVKLLSRYIYQLYF